MKTSAVAGTAMTLAAATYSRAAGSNDRIGVAFVGTGGRCQAHLKVINDMAKANKGVAPVAVCDVWDGHEDSWEEEVVRNGVKKKETRHYSQGLYPSAKTVGLNVNDEKHVVKDYR